ncbi:MAG: DivIVA domain-containing protein [Nitrospirales bacterium]
MKITPIEVQQMEFRVRLRGYDRDEVDRFLEDLAKTLEGQNRDNADLRDKLAVVEGKLAELKQSEATLSKTMVSVQAMSDDLKQAAQRDAQLIIKEAELRASELVREARAELASTHREIMELRKQRMLVVERLRSTLQTFARVLDVEAEESDHADSADRAERIARDTNL